MTGRTNYWPKDSAWYGRGRIIKVAREHGPLTLLILDFIICEAKAQNPATESEGWVKVAYEAIAYRALFGTSDDVRIRPLVSALSEGGLLDELSDDGDTFTCRISGWREDVVLPLEAARKRQARSDKKVKSGSTKPNSGDNGGGASASGTSGDVLERPKTSLKTKENKGEETHTARVRTSSKAKAKPVDPDALPADLPERLHETARQVLVVLTRVAEIKGAQPVTLAAVGRALVSYPDRDHLGVANDIEHYWCHGHGENQVRKDIVMTYRNRLKTQPAVTSPTLTALPGGLDAEARLKAAVLK